MSKARRQILRSSEPLFFVALLAASSIAAFAGPPEAAASGGRPPLRQILSATVAGAPAADFSGDLGSGELSQAGVLVRYNIITPLSKEWFFRGGPTWQGFYFDSNNPLVPDQLHEFVFDIGFGRKLSDTWTAVGWVSPGLASDLDFLGFEDFNMTGVFGAMWKPSETFEFMIGARWAVQAAYPFLPAAGFKWKFAPQWELNFMAPSPEIVWAPAESLRFLAGASINGGAYRMGDDYGKSSGRGDLAGEWLGFREIRAFGASEIGLWKGSTLRFEAGWIIDRKFEFVDSEETIEPDGAFYASAGLKMNF